MVIAIIVIVVLLVVLALVVIGLNNSMISARNRVDESWSGIDVQLKRRHDLVPNLVETVKGYATHEREVFEKVTAARAEATKAHTPAESAQKEGQLTQALTDLRGGAGDRPSPACGGSRRTTPSFARPRTSRSSRTSSPRSRTRSRRPAGSTTRTSRP